jgi:hypothetical protein
MPALQRLNLEDYDMETVPRYLQDVSPRHLFLDCSLSLLTSIAAGKSSPEWEKFSHIQQVKAYAPDKGCPRKLYVLYTREPFRFETNISRSAIAQGALSDVFLFPDTVFGLVCFLCPSFQFQSLYLVQHAAAGRGFLTMKYVRLKKSGW